MSNMKFVLYIFQCVEIKKYVNSICNIDPFWQLEPHVCCDSFTSTCAKNIRHKMGYFHLRWTRKFSFWNVWVKEAFEIRLIFCHAPVVRTLRLLGHDHDTKLTSKLEFIEFGVQFFMTLKIFYKTAADCAFIIKNSICAGFAIVSWIFDFVSFNYVPKGRRNYHM